MFIIDCEPIVYSDGVKVRYSKPLFCPVCKTGLAMWRYGYRKRKVRDFQGRIFWVMLPRYRCQKCGKIYLTLPNFLIPYKQYDRDTIRNIQNGIRHGCGASYQSIYLWSRLYKSRMIAI